MTRTKHDYAALEREYVYSDISIRQLCEKNGIANWSTVHQQAKKLEWERKRREAKEAQFAHDIQAYAQKRAVKLQEVFDDAVNVIHAAFLKMAENMRSPDYIVTPTDLTKLIEKLSLLAGGPTSREEVHNLNLSADLPPELLRDIQNTARANGAGLNTVGQSPLPVATGPRQVN